MSRPALACALILVLALLPGTLEDGSPGRSGTHVGGAASSAASVKTRATLAAVGAGPKRAPVPTGAPRAPLDLSLLRGVAPGPARPGTPATPATSRSRPGLPLSGAWRGAPARVTYHAHDAGIGLWGRLGDVSLYAGGFRLGLAPMQRLLRDWTEPLPRVLSAGAPDLGGFAGLDLSAGAGLSVGAEYRWFGDQAVGVVLRKSF